MEQVVQIFNRVKNDFRRAPANYIVPVVLFYACSSIDVRLRMPDVMAENPVLAFAISWALMRNAFPQYY
jgi:hypothetical protein